MNTNNYAEDVYMPKTLLLYVVKTHTCTCMYCVYLGLQFVEKELNSSRAHTSEIITRKLVSGR